MPGNVSRLILSRLFKSLPHCSERSSTNHSTIPLLHHFSTIHDGRARRERRNDAPDLLREFESGSDEGYNKDERRNQNPQNPPEPIPNRPLRGEKPRNPSENLFPRKSELGYDSDDDGGGQRMRGSHRIPLTQLQNKPMRGGKRDEKSYSDPFTRKLDFGDTLDFDEKMNQANENSPVQFNERFKRGEKTDNQLENSFLEKFKIGVDKKEEPQQNTPSLTFEKTEDKAASDTQVTQPEDADEIFKKMKETGLIPNAVAMLDGLCKDGLVPEAMKLFGLMREKGTIPEVVIYTAVVEGFCKSHKFDDAKRIFRKMQNNGISPNAFSYGVLVQGLCKGRRLEDAVEFCVEMLEAGHSPNVVTFAGLVDGICKEKGLEEAGNIIGRLREKAFFVDEKAVKEHLEKKGPFSPMVWEAIFGKKISQKPF
ncbi:pentatricopeptide repeat-containing protein At4g38150-like [Telopea speciosissima]|uniref:pentatricopeptide repeat-containing protein At4g38150-like n=1 Tax=Telopea speciosissima TaxID=54955 RepID=UPI001CC79FA6|nr:pentatricopeptide repeat-containing protein At4g38150-like [Telopea speciosissima]